MRQQGEDQCCTLASCILSNWGVKKINSIRVLKLDPFRCLKMFYTDFSCSDTKMQSKNQTNKTAFYWPPESENIYIKEVPTH